MCEPLSNLMREDGLKPKNKDILLQTSWPEHRGQGVVIGMIEKISFMPYMVTSSSGDARIG